LEKAKVIQPYVPLFGSSRASALLHILSRKKSVKRNSGLYKYGHGEKSIIWYWEFDVEKRYFHQFKTIDYAAAVRFYKANKFTIWEKDKSTSWLLNEMLKFMEEEEEGDVEDSEGEGDFHEHAAENGHEEQCEAETDVQGQNDGQNVRDDIGDFKDNDNQQDNEEEQRGNQDIVHSS